MLIIYRIKLNMIKFKTLYIFSDYIYLLIDLNYLIDP